MIKVVPDIVLRIISLITMATAKWMSAATIWIKAATSICGKYWNGSSLICVCLYSNNRLQLDQFFSTYALGEIICFEGIQDGIDNTNYFVETTQGSFVLTLFETLTADELPHFMRLLSHLVKHNIQCPGPQPDRQASVLRELNNKPAALFKRLSGKATTSPSIEQCQEIGIHLANVHLSTQDYVFPIKNNNDLGWCKMLLNKIGALLSATDRALINDELLFQRECFGKSPSRRYTRRLVQR